MGTFRHPACSVSCRRALLLPDVVLGEGEGQDVERKFNLQNFTLNLSHVDAFDRQRVLRKCDATVSIEDVDASIKRCSDKLENLVTMTAIGAGMDRYKYAKACRISFEKYLYELYKQLYILEHKTPTGEESSE